MKLAKMKDGNLSAVVTAETGEAAEKYKSEGYKPLCEMDGTGRTFYIEYETCITQCWEEESSELLEEMEEINNG